MIPRPSSLAAAVLLVVCGCRSGPEDAPVREWALREPVPAAPEGAVTLFARCYEVQARSPTTGVQLRSDPAGALAAMEAVCGATLLIAPIVVTRLGEAARFTIDRASTTGPGRFGVVLTPRPDAETVSLRFTTDGQVLVDETIELDLLDARLVVISAPSRRDPDVTYVIFVGTS